MSLRPFVITWPGRIVALVLVAAAVGGVALVARANSATPKTELRTATVARGSVTQTVSVSGSVSASGQARLAFKTGGRLAEVYVSVGQAVTVGQPLAKLDTTDLQTALSTAQQNLANAQASYQKQVLASNDTQQSLAEARRSTATDIANAQQALAKVKTNYATAKTNFTSLTNNFANDLATYRADIDTERTQIRQVLSELPLTGTSDLNSARNALNSADGVLGSVQSYADSVLTPSVHDYMTSRDAISHVLADFDAAVAGGIDTSGTIGAYQSTQLAYSLSATKLQSAIDTVTSQVASAQQSVTSAVASMNTQTNRGVSAYDPARADLVPLQVTFASQSLIAGTVRNELSQAGTNISTVGDAVTGGLVNAIASVASAQDRATTTLRQAQSAVANIPFNLQSAQVSVDNANNAVTTAQSNLDAAVLTAPAAGIVASIANQVGEFVSGGNTNSAFMVLTNTNTMALHGTVGEADISKLRLGQVANVTIDALAGQKMTGKVSSLDPVATISQGVPVYGIDVAIDVPAASLKAGMSGTASVILASKQSVLLVPNTAIRTVNGQRGVQVVKGGEAVETAVTFGLSNDQFTEAVSGLSEGDTIVIPQARAGASAQPNRGGGLGGGAGAPVIIGR